MDNNIVNEKNEKLEFRDHSFLKEPFEDLSPIQAVIKCSQIGWSTLAILKTLWAAKNKGWNIIYTLPTGDGVSDFVSSKVNPIIAQNASISSLVRDKDSVQQKQIGNSFIFYRGTHSGKSQGDKMESGRGIMLTSDLNVHDESDRSDQTIIEQYESRLANSNYKGRWYFSNPTAPGIGAHRYWLLSDQKHWFVKCSTCSHWQFLSWPFNIDRERKVFCCVKCQTEITDDTRRNGQWVKKYNNREISGYWISQLINAKTSAKDILLAEATKDKQYFYNFILGLPYKGSDVVVDRETIVQNIVLTDNSRLNVAMGVDNGVEKHYVIGNEEGIFEIGVTKDWKVIEDKIKRYNAYAVIDLNPYPKAPKELAEKYRGRVWCSFYKRDKDQLGTVQFGDGDRRGMVYSDRNKIIQETIDQIVDGGINYNLPESALEQYIAHWDNLYQVIEEDSLGVPRAVWMTTENRPDHFCLVGNTQITTIQGLKRLDKIKVGDKVLTRKGFKKVYRAWLTQKNVKVITINFSDGSSLTGTGNHKILTKRGWLTLDTTVYGDIIESVNSYNFLCQKSLSIKESNLDVIPKQKQEQNKYILSQMEHLEQKVWDVYMKKYGRIKTEKYQKVGLSIIRTAIRLIMQSKIWNACLEGDINRSIWKKGLKQVVTEKKIENNLIKLENLPINGIIQKMVKNGIVTMLIKHLSWLFQKSSIALNVKRQEKQLAVPEESFVHGDVSIVGMHENGEKQDVYNLSIEDEHEYFANGVLVGNCHATVYWRLAMMKVGAKGGNVLMQDTAIHGKKSFYVENNTMPSESLPDFGKQNDPEAWKYV